MNRNKYVGKKVQQGPGATKKVVAIVAIILMVIIGFFVSKAFSGQERTAVASSSDDLRIPKNEITDTAKFYPYKAGETNMEVLAVKASDGTIRTAFNTCQVCYDSGRGYYKQDGNVLVCQNCGNRFKMDQVEKVKGGCNPVPILEENKSDAGDSIVIQSGFMVQNKALFGNWKKS